MELQKLRYFYTVAKFQHMTRAAEFINIAQPALTQAIKSLEGELGVPLFEKKGRNIALTEYGLFLQNRLDQLLPQIDGIPAELEQIKQKVNKTVKLNILAASTFVIDTIVAYRQQNTDAVFDFEQNAQRQDCDIVIKTNGLEQESGRAYSKRCVKQENIYLAVPKESEYATLNSVELESVKNESFVMLSSSRQFGIICNRFCSSAGFLPKILFESDSPSAVQNIISTGTGIAFWPEYSWGRVNNKNVVLLPISYPLCSRELIIELYDRTPRSQYAVDFYNFLVNRI